MSRELGELKRGKKGPERRKQKPTEEEWVRGGYATKRTDDNKEYWRRKVRYDRSHQEKRASARATVVVKQRAYEKEVHVSIRAPADSPLIMSPVWCVWDGVWREIRK